MSRPTFPIVFGGGIDRASGTDATSPASMEVAENVVLMRGRVAPRKGMGEVRSNLGGCDYVAGMHPDRNTLRSVFVAGFGTPGTSGHKLEIWSATGSGRSAAKLGDWINPCESVEQARVVACQSGPYVILAHDEPSIERRAPTVAVNLEAGTITQLTAAWAAGDLKMRFRGVCAWLDYLVGWGFGTNLVDKPHMARISDIAEPLTFQDFAQVTAGQSGDALLACLPSRVGLGGVLLMRKQTETFVLTGDNFDNFGGPSQIGILHGLAAPRLTVSDGETEWFWSLEGPREGSGGASVDISWPLGLHPWPTPEDIAAAGRIDNGFAVYQPNESIVHFCFHDWLYSYTLETKQWSHNRLASPVHCGAILYARSGYEGPSRGYPDFDAATPASTSVTVTWDDVSPEGDETVEVWVRRVGGAWGSSASATASISLAPTATVNDLFTGNHEVSIRYRRDGLYSGVGDVSSQPTYDYTGAPNLWPAVSRGVFTIATALPTLTSLVWNRVDAGTERIAITYAGGVYPVQILRNTVDNAGTATLIHTSATPAGTYNDDAPGAGETTVYYYVRHLFPDASTGTVSAAYPRWIGPDAPALVHTLTNVLDLDADFYSYRLTWPAPPTGTVTKIEDAYICIGVWEDKGTTAADATGSTETVQKDSALSEDGSEPAFPVNTRARHEITQFSVLDYSDWGLLTVDVRIAIDETAYQSCP